MQKLIDRYKRQLAKLKTELAQLEREIVSNFNKATTAQLKEIDELGISIPDNKPAKAKRVTSR